MATYEVEGSAVLRDGRVWHNTIAVSGNIRRENALSKARRMLELWKGADNIVEMVFWFRDSDESRAYGESEARAMMERALRKRNEGA